MSGLNGPELQYSPGRIDPTNAAFNTSRKPLAGEFTFNGHTLFVIANHFNSKGGDQPLFGHFQPPTLSSETQRNQQAQIVDSFVDAILAVDPNANIIVLGDLNDFEFSTPITNLKGGVLNALMDSLPQGERYSYVFDGNSQALDHILVSNNLFNNVAFAYDVVHVNSEFAAQASDHEPQVARFTLAPAVTAVALATFRAEVNARGYVILNWQTTTESQIAGFNLWRKTGKNQFKKANASVIQAKHPGDAAGARYRFKNKAVRQGKKYRYKLEVIYLDGHSEWSHIVKVKTP